MSIALVPVKRLEQSKSRLLPQLPAPRRQALTLAMLADLLEALCQTPGLDRVAVTTPDTVVASLARSAGAEVLMRPEPGLNVRMMFAPPSQEHAACRTVPARMTFPRIRAVTKGATTKAMIASARQRVASAPAVLGHCVWAMPVDPTARMQTELGMAR